MNAYWPAPDAWQQALRTAITDPTELLRLLQLPPSLSDQDAQNSFDLRVPRALVSRMEPGNPKDPLLLQVLPSAREMIATPGYSNDPLAELGSNPSAGVVHKYRDRVLLITSGGCAINCRYCFRRHFPYQQNQLGPEQWQQALTYIGANPELSEAILSGGDPLVTPDTRLSRMITDLAGIGHLKRIRIHTRLPVVIPERVTRTLVEALTATRLQAVVVLHCNHPREVDDSVRTAITRLRDAGITVLNQAVLLRDINDSVDTLQQLSETLFEVGVLPYYLFVLDPVAGAAHFDVSDNDAQKLVGELQTRLPGYLIPRLAREIPGRPSKTLLTPDQTDV
ncbi:EF-P beta-lysylation protein EpmB [Marinobacterium sp. D7]|uniref:EF-P beta-lysylation protein EpmB n=1 Tax=Marinobacterium ramblicola TaxID=2849041 RepID=UPI001C2D581E|nr:EF-P beta-lysylation protein EpmB [Marinobacterium ramblicola]MBV1788784.1 EF-P beta-lysylation protein EpmB [Marinobacterium ramblicola]